MALGNGLSFIFDTSKGETPESVARKRALAAAIMGQMGNRSAKNAGEGIGNALASIGNGISVNVLNRRADKAQAAGQESANPIWDALTARMGPQEFPAAPGASPVASGGADALTQDTASASPTPSAPLADGANWLTYANQGATRNEPLNDKLTGALSFLPEMGVTMKVFSGGQEAEGPRRTGSHRHDGGNAGDVFFYKDGKQLNWADPKDRPVFEDIVRKGKAAGVTGFGAGDGYMQPGSMHLGFGAPAVWGAGGKGSNAPDWLKNAYNSPAQAANPALAAIEQAAPQQVASIDPSIGLPQQAPTPFAPQPDDSGFQVGGPAATSQAGNRVLSTMTNPQPMGGAPMPMQGMPQQTAQAAAPGPDLSKLPVMAGGSADAIQPGQQSQMGGPSIQQLIHAASNPWLNDSQKQVVNILLKQKMAESDPERALNMEYRRAQIAKLTDPNARDKFGNSVIWGQDENGDWVAMQPSSGGGLVPADTPEGIKLSPPGMSNLNLGTQFGMRDRNGQVVNTVPIDNTGKAVDTAKGKGQGEAAVSYRSMRSKMPGLEKVVNNLDTLADEATYTYAGRTLDAGRAQLGMEPRESAVARTKYISMVDNQILPLLRDTFGAQFTVQEGESLRATLGDPNKTPTEKKAVLQAFIEQKRRDVEALALQSMDGGEQPTAAPTAAPGAGGVVDYRDYFGGQ